MTTTTTDYPKGAQRTYGIYEHRWGAGPWVGEPDKVYWVSDGTPCLAVRGPMGNWCGYVGLAPEHRFHGVDYFDVDGEIQGAAHGGLTYAGECAGHICHVPEPGEPDDIWWLGFDCGHLGDLIPELAAERLGLPGTYKTVGFVLDAVERLARAVNQ